MDESMSQVEESCETTGNSGACLSLDEATCKAAANIQVAMMMDEEDEELDDDDDDDEDQNKCSGNKRRMLTHINAQNTHHSLNQVDDEDDEDDLAAAIVAANNQGVSVSQSFNTNATGYSSVDKSSPNNVYTFRKTEWDVKKMENYVKLTFNDPTTMDKMDPHLLNTYLKSFFEYAKKSDGMEYEPESLIGFMNSYERYLKTKNYPESLLRSEVFKESRTLLKNKRELVRSIGKLIRTKAKDTSYMLQYYKNILKEKGLLNRDNPDALLAEIYLNNTIYFGEFLKEDKAWRGNLNLVWGDILLECDPENGLEYLTLSITFKRSSSSSKQSHQNQTQQQQAAAAASSPTNNASKSANRIKTGTQTSKLRAAASSVAENNHHNHELSSPRVYAREPHILCPVEAYKLFRSRRPNTCLDRESPFYLAPNSKSKFTSKVWYKALAMSCQRLDALFYCLFKKANMDIHNLATMQDEDQRKMIDSLASSQPLEDLVVWKSNKPVSASTTPITITQCHPSKFHKESHSHRKGGHHGNNSVNNAFNSQHGYNSSYLYSNQMMSYHHQQSAILTTVPVQVQVQVQIQVQSKSQTPITQHTHMTDYNNNKSLAIY